MNLNNPERLDQLAAAYVLGTLRGGARRRFTHYLQVSPNARAAVARWETRLLPLAQSIPPEQPAPHVWRAIQERTHDPLILRKHSTSRWANIVRLLGGALGGAFVGAAFTIAIVTHLPQRFVSLDQLAQQQQQLPQSYVGLLTTKNNEAALLASTTRHGKRMTVKWLRAPSTLNLTPHTQLQLWAFPEDKAGKALAPFVVGVLTVPDKTGNTEFIMPVSAETLLNNVKRLAVAVMPTVDQPKTAPNEFILQGHCTKLW